MSGTAATPPVYRQCCETPNPKIVELKYTIALFFLVDSFFAFGQKLPTGEYKGLEIITVNPDKTAYWPGIYNFGNKPDSLEEKWYHEVSILVRDSSVTIEEKPITIKNGLKSYSDSTGGFYSYQGSIFKVNDTTFNLRGDLVDCKYCPYTATATPRYIRVFYVIHLKNDYWTVDTPFEKGLLFRKQ
jgi:hypothetical protein